LEFFVINNKLNIGFLASGFTNRYGSGTARVFESLIKLLCNKYSSKVDVTIFCNSHDQYIYLRNDPSFSKAKLIIFPDVKGKWLKSSRQYFKYSFIYKNSKIDILHFSVPRFYPFFWLFPAEKFICTFHAGGDITASKDKLIISREIYNIIAKLFYRMLDSIIAVSEYGKNEISQSYGIPRNMIRVMYPGTDDIWGKTTTTKRKYKQNEKKLIVVIGRWQQYKNVQVVSNALAEANPAELSKYYFVFVGKQISSNARLIQSDLSNLNKNLYETIDYLDEQDYVNIINEADLVIVPSLNEGFSLPVFDAYSFGTRVMLHNPSPAAQILTEQKGVFATDLSSSNNLLDKISYALDQENGTVIANRQFLQSIGATWQSMASSYVRNYEILMNQANFSIDS